MSEPDAPAIRRGVWFAVDVGHGAGRRRPQRPARRARRAGRDAAPATAARERDLDELAGLVAEYEAVGVVVGLPTTLAGREGASAAMAREYGGALAARDRPGSRGRTWTSA